MNPLAAVAVLVALSLAGPAWAHPALPGIGGAYAAFTHAITEPPAPLALLGLGLLVGINGAGSVRWACGSFFAATLGGLAATLALDVDTNPELPLVLVALTTGILTASGLPVANAAVTVLGLLTGSLFGVFAAPEPAATATIAYSSSGQLTVARDDLPWSTLLWSSSGAVLGANLALVFVASAVDSIRKHWPRLWLIVGMRVLASWVAAIAALMAALWTR